MLSFNRGKNPKDALNLGKALYRFLWEVLQIKSPYFMDLSKSDTPISIFAVERIHINTKGNWIKIFLSSKVPFRDDKSDCEKILDELPLHIYFNCGMMSKLPGDYPSYYYQAGIREEYWDQLKELSIDSCKKLGCMGQFYLDVSNFR